MTERVQASWRILALGVLWLTVVACGPESTAPVSPDTQGGPATDDAVAPAADLDEDGGALDERAFPASVTAGVRFAMALAEGDQAATRALLDPDVREFVSTTRLDEMAHAVARRYGTPVDGSTWSFSAGSSGSAYDYARAEATFPLRYTRGTPELHLTFTQAPGDVHLVRTVSIGEVSLATEPRWIYTGPPLARAECRTQFLETVTGGDPMVAHSMLEPSLAADVSAEDLADFQARLHARFGKPTEGGIQVSGGSGSSGSNIRSTWTSRFRMSCERGGQAGNISMAEHAPGAWCVTGFTFGAAVPSPTTPHYRSLRFLEDLHNGQIDAAYAQVNPLLRESLTRESLEDLAGELRSLGEWDPAKLHVRGGGSMTTGGRTLWADVRYHCEYPAGERWIGVELGLRRTARWRVQSITVSADEPE